MPRTLKIVPVLLVAFGIAFTGCQKKITKVTPEPEAPRVEEPTPPPPQEPIFEAEDIDASLREVLQTVYFGYDQYDLRPEAITKLEAIARFLQDHPSVRVLAQGHADDRGSSEYNMALGENRARAVKNYLTSFGISSDKIETTSYGEERLVNTNCNDDDNCHQQNRRVEWQVLAK